MDLPKLTYVEIDGVDVTAYIANHNVGKKYDANISTAKIGLKSSVSTLYDYNDPESINKVVYIKRGVSAADEKCIFHGKVKKITFTGGKVQLECSDMLSDLKEVIVNTSYDKDIDPEAGVISAIVTSLIEDNTNLTVDTVSSGTVNVLQTFILRHRILFDAVRELAVALNWNFYYDNDTEKVVFKPKGYQSSTNILTIGSNVIKVPKWNIDSSVLFNKIQVIGSPQTFNTQEGPYQLDGSESGWTTTSITLNKKPVSSIRVLCDLNATPTTEKEGGISGTILNPDYTVNTEQQKVTWDTDNFAPTTSYYAIVAYGYEVPVAVLRSETTSISKYGTIMVSHFKDEIKNNDDAAVYAAAQLQMYSEPFYDTVLKVIEVDDLEVGTLYQVVDSINDVNRVMMIKEIKMNYPYKPDEVVVGDKEYRLSSTVYDLNKRLRRLEEKQSTYSDKLIIYQDLYHTIPFRKYTLEIQKREIGDAFVLGHPENGVLGATAANELGDGSTSAWSQEYYVEY